MSWPVALVFSYVLIALQLAVAPALALGRSAVVPSFIVPLVVYIALFAPAMTAYWTALAVGLAIDLLSPMGSGPTIIPGPHALGMLAGTFLVVNLRSTVNRNTVSLVVLSIFAAAIAGVVLVAIITLRSWYTPIVWHAGSELVTRLLAAAYTGAAAALLSLVLFPAFGLFRFQDPYSRRTTLRPF